MKKPCSEEAKGRPLATGKGKGRRDDPKDSNDKAMTRGMRGTAHQFRATCHMGKGKGNGFVHVAQDSEETEYVDDAAVAIDEHAGNMRGALFEGAAGAEPPLEARLSLPARARPRVPKRRRDRLNGP